MTNTKVVKKKKIKRKRSVWLIPFMPIIVFFNICYIMILGLTIVFPPRLQTPDYEKDEKPNGQNK